VQRTPDGAVEHGSSTAYDGNANSKGGVDYTAIVADMDRHIERLDHDGVLRPTVINIGDRWRKKSRKGLVGKATDQPLNTTQQDYEKRRAFGLLDALTRGGGLTLREVSLHVIVAATHQFDKSIMQMVVQDNVNPIETVERSTLILASCVHRVPMKRLVGNTDWRRISKTSPALLVDEPDPVSKARAEADLTTATSTEGQQKVDRAYAASE